jgi:hypothetical protein
VYSGGIGTSQEASEIIMEHQEGLEYTRPGRETSLGWEGRLFRESRLGRETRLGRKTSLGFKGRLFRKSRWDRDSKLNRDISHGWEGGPCRESRLGRESRLSRETRGGWWDLLSGGGDLGTGFLGSLLSATLGGRAGRAGWVLK